MVLVKKYLVAALACLCLLLCSALAADSGLSSLPKLSQAEIAQLFQNAPLGFAGYNMAENPSTQAPYTLGQVSDAALNASLNRFNALRRLAGLSNVYLDAELDRQCQYGAVLLAATGKLSHHPDQPADMDDDFYAWGHSATSRCNIYQGSGATLPQAVDAFFDDSDAGNVAMLGHRRWMLNPTMAKTGLGFAPSRFAYGATPYHFATLWAFDRSGPAQDYDFIAWPASGSFPAGLFASDQAWSVTVNPDKYATPDYNALSVTLSGGGQSWSFDHTGTYVPSDAGAYFGLNTGKYGVDNAIIFRPDMAGQPYAGTYTVTIQGLKDKNGADAPLTYQVDFFDLDIQGPAPAAPDPGAETTFFTDVAAGSWYEEAVRYAVERELFNGVGGGRFEPNAPMTRAMVMTVLARLDGEDTTPRMYGETWDLKGRRWAVTNHISDGLNYTSPISLEELATMLYRYAQLRYDASPAHGYWLAEMPDGNSVSSWAADGTNWAVDEGILIGDETRRLNPQRPASRAQVAIILQRFLTENGL